MPSLDGLRAISIALVVIGHMGKSGHAPRIFWETYATVGVQVFFVISGFLITKLLIDEREQTGTIRLRDFYLRRAFRIFPAAMVFLGIVSILFWREVGWPHVAAAVFYLANFDNGRPWIFGHLWSLGVEEQFYLLWPSVLLHWYGRRAGIVTGVIVLAPFVGAAFYRWGLQGNVGAYPWAASNLAFGCLLAILWPRLPKIKPQIAILMGMTLALVPLFRANTAAKTLLLLFFLQPVTYGCMAGLLLHVVQTPYRFLNWGPIVWLGGISYSLYLWQQPFCSDPQLKHGYYVVFAVACACASSYLVEQPMLRLREKWLTKQPRKRARHLEISTGAA